MEAVAVIGMGCRFPGAPNIQSFWELLSSKGNAIREVPPDRYDINEYYDPKPMARGKVNSRYGGFLDQIDQFDADFFGISPREAAKMDPQHRLLMEVAWEAMEDAGLVPASMTPEERAGIANFIGLITSDYGDYQLQNIADLDVYSVAGTTRSGASGRISYALNLNGTSFVLDSACSSSLICVDQAVQTLRTGAHTIALAGGINIIAGPLLTVAFSQGGMMAPDGLCKAFDARADGYARSEGAGIVVLKLLSRALADGDRIYAVIRGTGSSSDGHCDSFMAPSTEGQQLGIRKALRNADVDPLSIDYAEVHGPGTRAGDPIEITTLGEVLCQQRSEPLLIGSVKTNIGHTEGAAGIAGLIKAVLSLQHGVIPPNLHFETPNPAIPWDKYAIKIPTELTPWPSRSGPRRAVVCSYGISGTNSYAILEEAPRPTPRQVSPSSTILLPLSARAPEALRDLAHRYREHLNDPRYAEQTLADIGYTASVRRHHHEYRLAVVGSSRQEIQEQLQKYLEEHTDHKSINEYGFGEHPQKVVWIFPGQGSQWLGMGRDLLEQEPVFRAVIERCDELIRRYTGWSGLFRRHDGWSLLEQLQADEQRTRLNEINVVQPTLFAIEIALAELWRSWGITPDVVVGHSMGEVAAAYIAGALSLEDAVWIICKRSELLLRASGKGAMAAVELTLEQATELVSDYAGRVSVAVSNSENSTVLSGDPEALNQILASLQKQNIFGRLVKVDVASHSPQMDPLREELFERMRHIQPRQIVVPMFSTVKAAFIDGNQLDASYWIQNLREPVLFHTAIRTLLEEKHTIFIEMSSHPLLIGAIRQTIEQCETPALALPSLRRDEPGKPVLLAALGRLYEYGMDIPWTRLYPDGGTIVSLPAYPWQRKRYWNDQLFVHQKGSTNRHSGGHPILGTSLSSALQPDAYFWTAEVSPEFFPFLYEHCVGEIPVLPGSAYTDFALATASEILGPGNFQVENLVLTRALFFSKGSKATVQATLSPGGEEGTMLFQVFTRQASEAQGETSWLLHAQATIRRLEKPLVMKTSQYPAPEQVQSDWAPDLQPSELYQGFRNGDVQHGPLFQAVKSIWRQANQTVARLVIPEDIANDFPGYQVHPALLDAVQHTTGPFFLTQCEGGTFLPTSVAQLKLYRSPLPGEVLWAYVSAHSEQSVASSGVLEADISLINEQGEVLLEMIGFRLQLLDAGRVQEFRRRRLNRMLYSIQWEAQASPDTSRATSRKTWLLFSEQQELGQALAAQIQEQGGCSILVTPGDTFRQLAKHQYELHPGSPEGFQRLFASLSGEDKHSVDGVIYLWGLLTRPATEDDPTYVTSTGQEFGSVGMLHLIQAMATLREDATPRLWVVTRGVHAIVPDDRAAALLQAPLWGLRRVVVYEHPNLNCTLIDLANDPTEQDAQHLFHEIWYENDADEVAFRKDQRYIARLGRQTLPPEQTEALFRPDGTYLITGGLGGVGLRTAQWMVEQGARHIVLMGRRGATEQAQATIEALREAGATIAVYQTDISQQSSLADALAQIRRSMPPLRGIFHSAVVLDDGTLMQLDRQRFLAVMPPKVDGTWNLHVLTREDPLDYFVMFSSAASSLGSPGQGNYSAAGAFMDALAFYRRQQNLPALCINWGRWKEVGQATQADRAERLDARGFTGMKSTEALTILGSLLPGGPPQISALAFSFAKWSQFFPRIKHSPFFAYLSQEEEAPSSDNNKKSQLTRDALIKMEGKQRQQALALYIGQQIAQVLGHPSLKLGQHQQIHRLGIDSLMAVELKNRINADLGVTVSPVIFLQGGSFGQLTNQIETFIK